MQNFLIIYFSNLIFFFFFYQSLVFKCLWTVYAKWIQIVKQTLSRDHLFGLHFYLQLTNLEVLYIVEEICFIENWRIKGLTKKTVQYLTQRTNYMLTSVRNKQDSFLDKWKCWSFCAQFHWTKQILKVKFLNCCCCFFFVFIRQIIVQIKKSVMCKRVQFLQCFRW